MISLEQISENIKSVRIDILRVSNRRDVVILGATKAQPKSVVDFVLENNLLPLVGENRAQEFVEKFEDKNRDRRHFIGRLQTNKVKYVVGKAALIHSVDSERLANEIEKCATRFDVIQPCLVEVNAGGEIAKGGVSFEELPAFYEHVQGYPHIKLCGIMGVMPFCDISTLISLYSRLSKAFFSLTQDYADAKILSAGMSHDFKTAIEYGGTTLVRLGKCIFGDMDAKNKQS